MRRLNGLEGLEKGAAADEQRPADTLLLVDLGQELERLPARDRIERQLVQREMPAPCHQ